MKISLTANEPKDRQNHHHKSYSWTPSNYSSKRKHVIVMAKILIVYDSKTGNTEKMAFAVAKGAKQVRGIDVEVRKASQTSLEDLQAADGIIMGYPTYYGQMSAKLKALIDK